MLGSTNSNVLLIVIAIMLSIQVCPVMAGIIDDFEDGVINTALWAIGEGNYGGGNGLGSVNESNGQLILDSFDGQRYGGGVSCAILKQSFVDVPVVFSFNLTLYDDTFSDPSYIQKLKFRLTDHEQADGPTGLNGNCATIYEITHNQQQSTNQHSGTYYYFLDSTTKEARLYNAADDSLLGSTSFAHFGDNDPYIAFDAYTDCYYGSVNVEFSLEEISNGLGYSSLPGSVAAIKADELHNQGITGDGVKIGMVEAPDDNGGTLPWSGHNAMTSNLLNGEANAADASNHATEVAGIMVGLDVCANIPPNGKSYKGVAPGAELAAAAANYWWTIDNAAISLRDQDCDVINISGGIDPDNVFTPDVNRTIDDIVDSDRVTIVCATGDMSLPSDDEIASPAEAYNVIAVGALGASEHGGSRQDGPWDRASSENIPGPTSGVYYPSGRCKPDLVAPGDCTVPWTVGADEHGYADDGPGSSFAAPHVAGSVALMIQAARDENAYFLVDENGNFGTGGDIVDPRIIKSALLTGADKSVKAFDGRNWGTIGSEPLDRELGAGGLDVEKAVKIMLGKDEGNTIRHMAFGTITWAEQTLSLSLGHLDEGSELTASLVWNAHYIFGLGMDLSDLDLLLYCGENICAISNSSVDNVEHIWETDILEGDYSLVVRYTNYVITDSEQFALSYSLVPEPATLSLLALGGLVMIRRRRRK